MSNGDLAQELAEHFAACRKLWASPPRPSAAARLLGQPITGPPAALGPVTPENIRSAIRLELMRFAASIERLRAAWKRLPPEFRKEVLAYYEHMDHRGEDWVWRAVEALGVWPPK